MPPRQLLRLIHSRRTGSPARPVRSRNASCTAHALQATFTDLQALVGAAAMLDLDDAEAVGRLREQAHELTARLAESGRLPGHLVVAPDDPSVVVVRVLAAALRERSPYAPSVEHEPAPAEMLTS